MKYYDRKNTPLKWNWVLKITLPLLLMSSLFHIISVFQQLFGLKNGNINDFLASAGYSMKNMGPLFWPVIFHTLMSCVSAVIVFYACVGLMIVYMMIRVMLVMAVMVPIGSFSLINIQQLMDTRQKSLLSAG